MSTGTVKAADGLNVRTGPSTDYKKLGKLKNNTQVELKGSKNGWYSINYSGQTGYICGSYVSVSGGQTSGGSTTASSGTYTITADALNVRKGPGTGNGIIGCLKKGNTVTAQGESNGWLKISYNGQVGWISKKYTKSGGQTSGGGGQTSGGSQTAKTGKVTASSLNVRRGPGTGNGIMGVLNSGASFSYTGESSGWLKISYKGQVGWISKKYTTVGGGVVSGGGGGGGQTGGSGTQKQRQLGQAALSTAISLYTRAVNEGWTYSQTQRMKDGHYDCSAYSDRSWRGAGITMGTNSEGQAKMCYNKGGQVSTSELIVGDLLFYHNDWNSGPRWNGINHVAVYDGNGGRYDAGGTPIKHYGSYNNGKLVMCCRPSVLA